MSDAKATLARQATFAPEQVPAGLRSHDSWICWRVATRDGEPTKLPVDPTTGDMAKANDPDTWADFRTAVGYHNQADDTDGIGFVFSDSDDIVGVDLDDCRDPETGEVGDWAAEIVETLDSFTEVSPSGTGFHVYVRGTLDDLDGNRSGGVELYDSRRFFTVTGDHVEDTPGVLRDRQDALEAVHGEHIADDTDTTRNGVSAPSATRDIDLSDQELLDRAMASGNGEKIRRLWAGDTSGYPSQSEADLALCNLLAFWTGGDAERIDRLFRQSGLYRDKWNRDDYRERTIDQAISDRSEFYDPSGGPHDPVPTTDAVEAFTAACEAFRIDPNRVGTKTVDGNTVALSVGEILGDVDVPSAVLEFNRNADTLSGADRQAIVAHVIRSDLAAKGQFFKTRAGDLYYFNGDDRSVLRVDGDGRTILSDDFKGLVWDRYNLAESSFSRNLGEDIRLKAKHDAPERAVYRFAHFDPDAAELYVNDFDGGYYTVTPEGITWRPNGADVFFLGDSYTEGYTYLDPVDRPDLPDTIPGERSMWAGHGDPLMRLICNRVNYADHGGALGPVGQRKQLYLHLHTLPFIDVLNERPIMAWVGEKGSGKTVTQRAIGRFIFGEHYTEAAMPDQKKDFLSIVTNQTLAFIDNYDDGEPWANDILASIATGTATHLRELWTTLDLRREVPRCWLSLTSRDPPFRRDDVADRLVLFRVDRLDPEDDDFCGMTAYLNQVSDRRDLLWSTYLDNLQRIVAAYDRTDIDRLTSTHRMADWAIMVDVIAGALGVDGVTDLVDTMQAERAAFALENEDWAATLGRWIRDHPDTATQYHQASDLVELLTDYAANEDLPFDINSGRGLGSLLSQYQTELYELYDLEIDDSGRTNTYRFDTGDDIDTGLDRY